MKPLECHYITEAVRNLEGDTNSKRLNQTRSLARGPEHSIRREEVVDVRYAELGLAAFEVFFESVDESIFE
jgi:hypothetical protein